jgi:uncharacterized metal-binding protein
MNVTDLFTNTKPLVYSCSGCSSAAQMANYLAIQLDRLNLAEMSCIAGVGGNVKKLVDIELTRFGVLKKQHEDFSMDQANDILDELRLKIKNI